MSQLDDLLFETERRSILFHRGTSMPDGTQLGYDGDPNDADPLTSDGEFLLYHCPSGTRYVQKNTVPFTTWDKVSDNAGGLWLAAGTSGVSPVPVYSLPTNVAIGGNRAIATSGEYACYADCSDINKPAIAISKGAVSAGDDVPLQVSEKMTISGAGFTPGEYVFVGLNGVLTQTPSTAGYSQIVGVAHSSEILLIEISQPIFL